MKNPLKEVKAKREAKKAQEREDKIVNPFEYDLEGETEWGLEQVKEVNNAIEENKEQALEKIETQISDPKAQKEAEKAIEAATDAGEKAVKKGKSWAEVKKAMDDKFDKAFLGLKKFGKDVCQKIKKIYEGFMEGVKKAWKKVFDLVYRKEKVSKGEKGYTYKVPDKAEVEKEEKERKAGIEALKQAHREARKKSKETVGSGDPIYDKVYPKNPDIAQKVSQKLHEIGESIAEQAAKKARNRGNSKEINE